MNIVLIHGQNHTGSSCHIGRLLAQQFAGSRLEEFFLPRDAEHFCLGCCRCIEADENCPFYADKQRIMQAAERADLLIFTTPTYCMRASAPMKAFIDLTFTYWMPHRPRACMFTKKAVVISTAAGAGAGSAVKDIATALFYWGVPWVKRYGTAVQAMNWETVAAAKKEKIQKDMAKLAKRIAAKPQARAGIKTKFIFSMMRMMQKSGHGSGAAEREYWQANGWLDKARPWR